MIGLAFFQLGPLMLMGGYFLNGGVGILMQPNANASGGAGPTPIAMTTISGTGLTTVGGTGITTGVP